MDVLTLIVINGVLYGLLLFLLCSGLTLIFSVMGVLNFAHASFYMVGAYIAFEISRRVGFWPALIGAPLALAAIGFAIERWGLRRFSRVDHVPQLLFTFGLAFIFQEAVLLIWGPLPQPYDVPPALDITGVTVFSAQFSAYRLFIIAAAIGVLGLLYWLLNHTQIGMIIRASLHNVRMVGALGHDADRIFGGVFALGSALAGLAGALAGNLLGTDPTMATSLGTLVFVVIIIGGLGSLKGALFAALFIGLLQTAAVTVGDAITLPGSGNALSLAQIAPLLPYLLMVVILVVRPQGFFGQRLL